MLEWVLQVGAQECEHVLFPVGGATEVVCVLGVKVSMCTVAACSLEWVVQVGAQERGSCAETIWGYSCSRG